MSAVRVLSIVWLVVVALLGTAGSARAQAAPHATPPGEEAADSPRASMRAFLDLCDHGRYAEAARYLDVPKGAEKRTAELAQRLDEVLDERLLVEPDRLSPLSGGRADDGLPAGTDELGKIPTSKGHSVPIRIVRHDARTPDEEPRWLFSQSTVLSVDALYAALRGRWIRDHLPSPLLVEGPKSLYYWQWLALPVLALGCLVIGRLAASLSDAIARPFTRKRRWAEHLIHRMGRPVTMAWALAIFWLLLPYLALTLRAEDLVERILRALGYLTFFWALVRAVTIAGDEIAEAKWSSSRPNIRSVTSVGVRLGKVIVGALALMVALSELGYPVTTVIAGLGIGGVALALAATKTVEHVFGSISILVDRPFGVGDTIRVDGVEATVELIGLRSTRMRTSERTLVIIPNGKLAEMRIESLTSRDRLRFATKLALARDTPALQIEAVVEGIRAKLRAHPSVEADEVSVRLTALGEWSFDVDVAALVATKDPIEFAKVREELLLTCIKIVDGVDGARLAVPTRQILGQAS